MLLDQRSWGRHPDLCTEPVSVESSNLISLSCIHDFSHVLGHPLHKFYNYAVIHISELIEKRHTALEDLLGPPPSRGSGGRFTMNNRVLVVDCITSYAEPPMSPVLERSGSGGMTFPPILERSDTFPAKMHLECRRRQFGSDMEILVRALCAQKGWNAIISRRKRGCLGCAIREAGALGWRVIIRVE